MTERAVDHVATPMLGETFNVRKFIDEAGRNEYAPGDYAVTANQLDAESTIVGSGHVDGAPLNHLAAVAPHLFSGNGCQLCRRETLVAEVAVHVRRRRVSRLVGVDHDDRATLPSELQTRGKASRRRPNDRDFAMPLHNARSMFTHAIER